MDKFQMNGPMEECGGLEDLNSVLMMRRNQKLIYEYEQTFTQ